MTNRSITVCNFVRDEDKVPIKLFSSDGNCYLVECNGRQYDHITGYALPGVFFSRYCWPHNARKIDTMIDEVWEKACLVLKIILFVDRLEVLSADIRRVIKTCFLPATAAIPLPPER